MMKKNNKTAALLEGAGMQASAEPLERADQAAYPRGKLGTLVDLLRRPEGASLDAMTSASGWQAHSVRGAMSGALKKKLGLAIISAKTEAGRVWRIEDTAA